MAPILQAAAARKCYKKTPGCVTLKGQMFEIKMAALLFARASNRGIKFSLATNVDGAGSFDDILFRYHHENSVWRNTFIQMKHKPKVHLNLNRFLGKKGEFALKTYHASFSHIKEKLDLDSNDAFFKGTIENCEFIIFTTAELDNALLPRVRPCSSGPMETLLETKSKSIFSFCENVDKDVYDALSKYNLDSMHYFLRSLKLFTAQPREEELDKYLVEEIRTKFKVPKIKARLICSVYVDEFKNWWSNRKTILNETSDILDNSFNQYKVTELTVKEVDKFRRDVTFQDTKELNCLFDQGTSFLQVVPYSDNLMALTCNKLLQVVDEKYETYIFVRIESLIRCDNREAVISDWRCGKSDLLVIVCGSEPHDATLTKEIFNILSQRSLSKKVIVVSGAGNMFVENVRKELGENYCSQIQEKFYLLPNEYDMLSSGDRSQGF